MELPSRALNEPGEHCGATRDGAYVISQRRRVREAATARALVASDEGARTGMQKSGVGAPGRCVWVPIGQGIGVFGQDVSKHADGEMVPAWQ